MKLSKCAMAVALAAALFGAGCATEHYAMDAKHPSAVMASDGMLEFRGRFYSAEQFPRALKKAGIPYDRGITIRVPEQGQDKRLMMRARGLLGTAGYRRVIFVTDRHAVSTHADGIDPMKDPRVFHEPGKKVYGAGW